MARALDAAPPGVVICPVVNEVAAIVRYLGAARAGRPVLLCGPDSVAVPVRELVGTFAPAAVLGAGARPPAGYAAESGAWVRRTPPEVLPHPDLGLLLATSGSTGRPRLVRMSRASVAAITTSIRGALGIDGGGVAVTTMPPYYTFGLSVLHTHLQAGGTVVVTRQGVLQADFWRAVNRHGVTSIAGVPHTYELLRRLPWHPERSPTVRSLTVSGGRLPDDLATRLHELTAGGLYVMYGQTEAGSRICVLPPGRLPEKLGSVGPPIPGVRLSVEAGEVVCHSPGVMMGYAETAADLARGDDLGGVLHTGDSGHLDADGHLWLHGRLSRIGKAFGVRANLDAVEHLAAPFAVAAAVPAGDRIRVVCETADRAVLAQVVAVVTGALGLHRLGVRAEGIDRLPRRPNGKIDYHALDG
ncbi:AMP-binding protein [Phytohabitans houttuyneae]|uniref:AMP-dependent acyl-CoA synthetase n=1 Tax=Phytohabitans houttuyneae TaxID=1076126 RepID=A0A6V8JYG6_9ACTN|nr:AMP-binding protein [Phytohabitans houttuyneae]GFJ76304.1 AMP-dependent acyl-CoA synthetase [Phytohabitans houttuyneae]